MRFIDKMLDKMKLGADDDYDDDFYDDGEDEVVAKPKEAAPAPKPATTYKEDDYEPKKPVAKPVKQAQARPVVKSSKPANNGGRVVNMQGRYNPMEVCVIKPTTVEDSREIADTLLSERAVVLNLEGIDVELAQRIIDFTSGACFAIDGKLKKISNYIFIATPSAISISGDLLELFGTSGINGDSVSYNADTTTF